MRRPVAGTEVVLRKCVDTGDDRPPWPRGRVAVVRDVPAPDGTLAVDLGPDGAAFLPIAALSPRALPRRWRARSWPADRFAFEAFAALRVGIGPRSWGLDGDVPEVVRGVYVPPGEITHSLAGAPAQVDDLVSGEILWEIGQFVRMAAEAHPEALEVLYADDVQSSTRLGDEIRALAPAFLSQRLLDTMVSPALRAMETIERRFHQSGEFDGRSVMHVLRALAAATVALETGALPVATQRWRAELVAVGSGKRSFGAVIELHRTLLAALERAINGTSLPDEPDLPRIDRLLQGARRRAAQP